MMATLNSYWFLMAFTSFVCGQQVQERQVNIPPVIIEGPEKEIPFVIGESIEVKCVASGQPQPVYRWEMDDRKFEPSGNDGRVAVQPGVGTLIFANPIAKDEGVYQCFATNRVGTAVTVKVYLRPAILDPYPAPQTTRNRYPKLGSALKLMCNRPRSYPNPQVFWGTISDDMNYFPILLTARITLDPEGNLLFANVIPEDFQQGRTYACHVHNKVKRSTERGSYQKILPQGQTMQTMAPKPEWFPPNNQLGIRGREIRIKCIFSGSPTPRVSWSRTGKPMSPRARMESFGQELVIENLQFDDAGSYQCEAINTETPTPIRQSFVLNIESAPYWKPGKRPQSVDAAENDKAVFYCEADALPTAEYHWFLNGVAINKVPADSRRISSTNMLVFENMQKSDAQTVQCNATNQHGYVFTNAYLSVLSEPPLINIPPRTVQKAAEGQNIELSCVVFGSPKPIVIWHKGLEQLTGGRFKVMNNGNLQILDVSLVDAGMYTCTARNKFDTVHASGNLIVRRKTQIQMAPLDITVYEHTEAKLTCTATTDPEEEMSLRIDWRKDDQPIDYAVAQRVFKNTMDNSLTISGLYTLDTGKYTCVASNGLDSDESDAQLVVQGIPDEPNSVKVVCSEGQNKAEITWQPGRENFAPILNYVVQFNTTFEPDTWIDLNSNVSQSSRLLHATLSPWGNYTFRVLARNKIGISEPSKHTVDKCTTKIDVPFKNPENVIGEGDLPDNLVIFWTPMPKVEQNAASFSYVIRWRRADIKDAQWNTATVDRPDAWHYVVPESQETYKPFDISVQAKNEKGESKGLLNTVRGYSGEDEPLVYPTDVSYDPETLGSTEVVLTWTQVDTSPEMIRGFFRGYRIQFGKAKDFEENFQETDFILNMPLQYPRPRIKRDVSDIIRLKLHHLPAFSDVKLQVRVLNKYYAGKPSASLEFRTLEGEPGPPAMFDVHARGPTHFELRWEPPYEVNGVLTGYNISYQTISGLNLGRLQYREPIYDPSHKRVKLTGLLPDTFYRVYLYASTKRGKGEPIFLDMKTTPSGKPTAPSFSIMEINETSVNVSWIPSFAGNPGSVFYIQYRPRGSYMWLNTQDEVIEYNMAIPNLFPGTTYQIRVVSKNGEGEEAPSVWQEFNTDGVAPGGFDLSRSPWFYGIWLSLFLIILFLIFFFLAKKYTDKWWIKKESEIEDQVRQLKAEEAAMQMGIMNQYATGSREMLPAVGQPISTSHKPSYNDDYYADADFDEDEFDRSDEAPEYRSQPPYQPPVNPQYQPPSQHPQYSPTVPPTRFVTGESHQMAPGQFVNLDQQKKSVEANAADTFV